jgi:hypothetical protein
MYNASATLVKTWPKTIGVALVIILVLSVILINAYNSMSTPESKAALSVHFTFGVIGTVLSVLALVAFMGVTFFDQQPVLVDKK